MSAAFDRFLAQYGATGREKAEGYTRQHFDGLTPSEKARAFDLLADEARRDPTAAEWLFELDPARAPGALRAILTTASPSEYGVVVLRGLLARHTGDVQHQRAMIDAYEQLPADQQKPALEHLARTPATPPLRAFLAGLVLNDPDESRRASAAYHLVVAHGVPYQGAANQTVFRELLKDLTSASAATRQAALAKLTTLDRPAARG